MSTTPTGVTQEEFLNNARRLEELVKEFEVLPYPQVQEKVFELLQSIDTLHRAGLTRLVELLQAEGQGEIFGQVTQDPVVQTLFQLYDLASLEPHEYVVMALEDLREFITSLGCMVEFMGVEQGVVHLRLSGECQTNPEIEASLRESIETSLRKSFPGFHSIQIEEPARLPETAPTRSLIPLDHLRQSSKRLKRPVFTPAIAVESLPEGSLHCLKVDGVSVLLCQIQGEFFAYHNNCPGSPLPLDMGKFDGRVLLCPWHQCLFDLKGGQRVEGGSGRLAAIPLAVRNGMVELALKVETVKEPLAVE